MAAIWKQDLYGHCSGKLLLPSFLQAIAPPGNASPNSLHLKGLSDSAENSSKRIGSESGIVPARESSSRHVHAERPMKREGRCERGGKKGLHHRPAAAKKSLGLIKKCILRRPTESKPSKREPPFLGVGGEHTHRATDPSPLPLCFLLITGEAGGYLESIHSTACYYALWASTGRAVTAKRNIGSGCTRPQRFNSQRARMNLSSGRIERSSTICVVPV